MIDQSLDEKPLLWNYYSKHGIFRREEYYFGLLCLICISMVLYCKSDFYSFGLEHILAIGNVLANVFLGLSTIMDGPYDIKTKEFYSLFYLFVPVYFVIGLLAGFFISPYRYRVLVIGVGKTKIIIFLIVYSLLSLLPMVAPMVGFNTPVLFTSFNTVMSAGIVYAAARMLVAVVTKFNLRS